MIWRLTYCNKKGVEARIDIIKGNRTPVEIVQGSGQPFTLSYKLDKNDKSGHIMTSSADIEIFETETFNIDDLKTSNETELKVEYFEDNVLTWSGFILPDFFSREIGSPNIVRMTASDRLTALKGVTLSDLPSKVSLRDLIELSLAQTGLSLGLVSQIQINQGSTNILDSEILSQRLTDVRGRSISCYDILMSIMVGTNSTIRQRKGQWQVYNKLEHELRTPTISFDKVERGAIRTIQPVASSVGVYNEFGGSKMYPQNYDFSNGLTWWTTVNGFNAGINNKEVTGYTMSGGDFFPIYGGTVETNSVINKNASFSTSSSPYLKSENVAISYPDNDSVDVTVEVNATGVGSYITNSFVEFAIIATNTVTSKTLSLSNAGVFETMTNTPHIHRIKFPTVTSFYNASTGSLQVKGVLVAGDGNLGDYDIHVRIYGSGEGRTSFINSATIKFSVGGDNPKGNLYKTTQGSNFTKQHDIETVIFGDYIRGGINGHFYYYPIDDTSNLYLPSGTLSPPQWITAFDTTERPLLHHISRQKSSLFSVAHDILKANINVESFDPLAIFQDCKGGKYVVVSASFDFLRSEVNVELEQIAYDNTISKRDYIYSYFGEGESNIKSIGGISGGSGGSGGGGMTSEQLEMLTNLADWWRLDEENDAIYSLKSVYSLKGVSALGLGSEGGGGGGDFDRLDAWVDYNETKANWVLSALLGYDLHTRVNDLEASGGSSNIDIAITGSGNAVTGVSLSGNTLTFAKSSTFALSTHNHTIANITGLQDALDGKEPLFIKNTAFNKNFGTTAGTVAQGNHTHSYLSLGGGDIKRTFAGWPNAIDSDASNYINQRIFGVSTNNNTLSFFGNGNQNARRFGIQSGHEDPRYASFFGILELNPFGGVVRINGITAATINSNVASATKLQTARTIAGVSFDGTANIAIPFANLASKPTTLEGYGITDAVTTNTTQSITGTKTFTKRIGANLGVKIGTHSTDGLIEWDATNNAFKFNGSVYATGGISALGLGEGGGSGGGGVDMLQSWETYTSEKANFYVPASLLVPFRDDTLSLLTSLEAGVGGRNLIINSLNRISFSSTVPATIPIQDEAVSGESYRRFRRTYPEGVADNRIVTVTPEYFTPEKSGYYTYSTYFRPNEFDIELRLRFDNSTYGNFILCKANEWTQVSATTYIEAGVATRLYGVNGDMPPEAVQWIDYNRVSVISGNKATDWSPAPEDQVSDWNTTDVTSFSYIKNKPTQLSQFTDNIGVGSHIANKSNPHEVTTAQIGAVDLTTNQSIGGKKTFNTGIKVSQTGYQDFLVFERDANLWSFGMPTNNLVISNGDITDQSNRLITIGSNGNIRIGDYIADPPYKLDVSGTGRFTSSLNTPKVDFGNGFTIEPSGTELVFKYNGVIKQRMLSTGTILATGGVTSLAT